MNRRGTPSTLICIHKSDKGDNLDRYSNLAFVEIPIAKAILTESADEAKSLLKGYVLNSQQKKIYLDMMERRMKRKFHVRCEAGENLEITSKSYLSL